MKRIRSLSKLPKRKVTISDLLEDQQRSEVVEDLLAHKDTAEELVVFWTEDGRVEWSSTDMPLSRLVYLLELVKFALLREEQ